MQLAFLDVFPDFSNGIPTARGHFLPFIDFSLIRNTQNLDCP